jgi:hypothetical protein
VGVADVIGTARLVVSAAALERLTALAATQRRPPGEGGAE